MESIESLGKRAGQRRSRWTIVQRITGGSRCDSATGPGLLAWAWVWASAFAWACVLMIGPGIALASLEGEWTLEKQQDGISVYTRPVAGSGIKEFKGEAEISSPVDAILRVLRDSDGFKDWFPNCPESKLLAREENVSYQYSVMSTPWPLSDRDNIFRSETRRSPGSGVVVIEVTAAPDYSPERGGRVRVRKARGSWKLEPVAKDRTRVTFTMHLEPGGGIPEWMINARVVGTPFEALTNLRVSAGS